MNILVTGSNGFIGHHVAKYLRDRREYVIGLGRSEKASDMSVVDEYISCDLSTDQVYEILNNTRVEHIDAVIHLAADMRREPHCVEVVEANCGGTQRLLEFCEEKGIGVFLQLSSLPVIGHPVEHPITEEHPLAPYTVYHITKHTEEMLAEYAYSYRGIRTASFRISAPVGPGVNPNTIFPTFVRNALAGKALVLAGKGTRKQNYVHARDIAQALHKSLYAETVHGVYNLTGDLLISNFELAELCIKVLGSESKVEFSGKEDPADDYVWDASLEKLKRDCDYEPVESMEKAVIEYAQWCAGEV
jgi:UDP-glucose 4-epimerase